MDIPGPTNGWKTNDDGTYAIDYISGMPYPEEIANLENEDITNLLDEQDEDINDSYVESGTESDDDSDIEY